MPQMNRKVWKSIDVLWTLRRKLEVRLLPNHELHYSSESFAQQSVWVQKDWQFTLVYLQDGVGHGSEEPLSIQDENVPQPKGQGQRCLQDKKYNSSPHGSRSESGSLCGWFPNLRGFSEPLKRMEMCWRRLKPARLPPQDCGHTD